MRRITSQDPHDWRVTPHMNYMGDVSKDEIELFCELALLILEAHSPLSVAFSLDSNRGDLSEVLRIRQVIPRRGTRSGPCLLLQIHPSFDCEIRLSHDVQSVGTFWLFETYSLKLVLDLDAKGVLAAVDDLLH